MDLRKRGVKKFRAGLTGILTGVLIFLNPIQIRGEDLSQNQKIKIELYNETYFSSAIESVLRKVPQDSEGLKKNIQENTVSLEQLCEELADSRAVIFSDVEFSSKQKAHINKIVGKIAEKKGKEKVVMGLELFYANQDNEIERFIRGEISRDQLYANTGYDILMKLYDSLQYGNMLDFLKNKGIKTIGINKPINPKIFDFLKEMSRKGEKPPYKIPEGFTEEEIMNLGFNFYERDVFVSERAKEILQAQEKTFICFIGAKHGYENHLPKIMKEIAGIKPRVVEWSLDSLHFMGGRLYFDKSRYERLNALGLNEDNALGVGEDFFINFELDEAEANKYYETIRGVRGKWKQ